MPRSMPAVKLDEIERVVRAHSGGATAQEIGDALSAGIPRRTLQYRLKSLVDAGRLVMGGTGRGARSRASEAPGPQPAEAVPAEAAGIALSPGGDEIRTYLRQPQAARKPVGHN